MKIWLFITSLFLMSLVSTSALAHKIGEQYQGGIIFWMDDKGEHGLIASMQDEEYVDRYEGKHQEMALVGQRKHAADNIVIDADHDGILAGKYNTNRIVQAYGAPLDADASAVWTASTYMGGGYGDWYLPSKYELNLLRQQNIIVSLQGIYFSSTTVKDDVKGVWAQYFDSTTQGNMGQITIYRHSLAKSRCIRAF